MKFTAPKGKQVVFKGSIIAAKDGGFETEDKDLIEVLKNARGVEPVKGRPPTSQKEQE